MPRSLNYRLNYYKYGVNAIIPLPIFKMFGAKRTVEPSENSFDVKKPPIWRFFTTSEKDKSKVIVIDQLRKPNKVDFFII